jgi:GAF domain-containing protein
MADQVAVAIDNARLFAEARDALRDIEVTQRRYVTQAWSAYQQASETVFYETGRPTGDTDADTAARQARQAVEQGTALVTGVGSRVPGRPALVAPITFRGQVLGVVGLEGHSSMEGWREEDIALVEAVAGRLGIAVDSLRLLEQTQSREARERLTRQISQRLQAAPELEDVLRIAAQELGRELDAVEVVLRLGGESQLGAGTGART